MTRLLSHSLIVALLLASGLPACRLDAANPKTASPQSQSSQELIQFEAKVVRLELEGGFWGLVAEDGQRYDPRALAPEFQVDGLRVRVKAEILRDVMHFHMWGTIVRVLEIEPLDH